MAQLLIAKHGMDRSRGFASPPKTRPSPEEDTESEDDDLFFDTVEYNEDFEEIIEDESTRVLSLRDEIQIQQNLKELVQKLQSNAKILQERLEKMERARANGIFLSWRSIGMLVGWPVVVLLVYHFWVRKKKIIT